MFALMWQPPHRVPLNQWENVLLDVVSEELSTAKLKGLEQDQTPDVKFRYILEIMPMLYCPYLSMICYLL